MQIQVCEQCGQPFDATGFPICPECKTDTFIKLDKEKSKGEPTWQPNLKTK